MGTARTRTNRTNKKLKDFTQHMHHLMNKIGHHNQHCSPSGNIQPKLDLRNAGYGFAEITLQRDMHTVRATVGNVFITYTREKKPDPFVILVVDDIQQQTTHRDNTKQAFFGETFVLPCHPGSIMDVYVADKDWLKDDLMFNGSIPLDEIPLGRTVTVHVRREPGISTNDYTIHEEPTPELPLFIPPNQYAEHTPLFTDCTGDVSLYLYDIAPTFVEPPPVVAPCDDTIVVHEREEPIVVHEEPIVVHEEPVVVHEDPIVVHEELIEPEPVVVHEEEPEPIFVHRPEPILVHDEPEPEPIIVHEEIEREPVFVEPEPVFVHEEPEPITVIEEEPEPVFVHEDVTIVEPEPLIVREEPEPIFVHEEPEPITVIEEAPTTVIHRTGPAVSRVTTRVTTIVHPPRVIEERHHVLPCAVY